MTAMGLSPRVRGNQFRGHRRSVRAGSIPACAGEPRSGWRPAHLGRVYPRVCGGTGSRRSWKRNGKGLSPRVRGNPRLGGRRRARGGSIPACAGEPCSCAPMSPPKWVYPRVCGGTKVVADTAALKGGLSPRVRGNRVLQNLLHPTQGSIPACAGEPNIAIADLTQKEVYPRVCGGTPPVRG